MIAKEYRKEAIFFKNNKEDKYDIITISHI